MLKQGKGRIPKKRPGILLLKDEYARPVL